jgi:hypothetical protein
LFGSFTAPYCWQLVRNDASVNPDWIFGLPNVKPQNRDDLFGPPSMFQKIYLIVSGLLIVTGIYFLVAGPGNAQAECQKLIEKYDNGRKIPASDDPMRTRFVECYYMICGIRLDL